MTELRDILNIFGSHTKGTYLLFLSLKKGTRVRIGNNERKLEKGHYIHVGSAFGAGGIKSRITRHFMKNKKIHWHIDKLTTNKNTTIEAFAVAIDQRAECIVSSIFSKIEELKPIYGFGNTDCKNKCPSHLFFINF